MLIDSMVVYHAMHMKTPRPRRGFLSVSPSCPATSVDTCPHCGCQLSISPVNISRCTNIGGPWKSVSECVNRRCHYSELSIHTPEQRRSHGL